ncbi:single-stranded DNA-binding protein [Metasolibacillus sp.]|uniref:single-stranded DNA-binding protein n=1 Tax=Metasolibacillus sp. TaxID=2703680 RepID=UPI0025EBDD47|nr:single-stranded DNA-binding protein [Metasolibacillus sp.]MCT6923404.1 single-stranded DNA-binding protein [Metasolibacillus sp.]MCT6939874.1 single-stranded DNA-binding protein [Metasolibacillus sp.]
MNQIGLVGRLTKNPQLRQLSDTKVQTSFVLAINRNYRNSEGSVDADYVLCVAWGRLAEHIAKYCGKGSLIGINGRLHTRSYVNKENNRVFAMDVLAESVRFYALKQSVPANNPPEESSDEMQHVMEHFVLPEDTLPTDL